MNAPDCVFCRIMRGDEPASVFYEDAVVMGLMTIAPAAPGHALVMPKAHAAFLADMDEETGRRLWTITQRTAHAIRRCGVRCEGVDLFLADGQVAGQTVLHVHMHLFPRFAGDGFQLEGHRVRPPREHLDRVADQIAKAYGVLYPTG